MGKKGKGEKEPDEAVREFPLFCRLPVKKVKAVDFIVKKKGISRTDAISQALDLWIEENSVYIQENDDIY